MQNAALPAETGEITQKIHQLFRQYPLKKFPKNKVLFDENQKVDHFYFLEKGVIKMSSTNDSGKVVSLHLLYEGSVFPLLSLAKSDVNHYLLQSVTEVEVRPIPRLIFKEWLMTDPEICYYFFMRVAGGLTKILSRLEGALANTALRQLAGILMYFSYHQQGSDSAIELSVTHQELADWLGLTRENVTLQMRKLVTMGVLRSKHGKLVILDKKKLASLGQIESVADEL